MIQSTFPFKPISAHFRDALGRTLRNAARKRRRSNVQLHHQAAALEQLEQRTLLSYGDIYPDLVETVGVYDENAVQTNTVDAVADGSHMTDVEFADRLATAWANNDGGVIDGTGDGEIFGFGPDLWSVLHVASFDDTGWMLGTPPDRPAISGDGAFASIYAPSTGGYNVLTKWFGVESFEPSRSVLEIGVTVLGQNLEDYGTVYLIGHTAFGDDVLATHQVLTGGTEDVFYGVTAPPADYFIGFSLAYAPEGEWIVDKPLWFDDLGVIIGDHLAAGNQAPTAVDDSYTLDEDTSLTTYASYGSPGNGVLANDVDPESHDLTAILLSGPSYGTLDWNFDGGFTYTPDADFSGTDSFTYKAHDGFDESNVATVTLTVTALADPPVAQDDAFTLDEDDTLSVAAPGLLGNDSDPDGDPLTAVLVSGPSHGSLTFSADGSFVYTPDANYDGADAFTYQAEAGGEQSNVATVMLTVEDVNAPPIAAADSYTLDENTTLAVSGPGVLANDSDQDGDPLTAVLVSGSAHGALTFNADGSFSYTPVANFYGPISFTYQASDGTAVSNPVAVTLNVASVNVAPVASDDSYTVGEDGTLILPSTPTAELTMVSEPGDYIGQGQTYDLDHTTGTFTASRNFDNGVRIYYTAGPGDWWTLEFAAPGEVPLTAGVYTDATRFPFQSPNVPGLSVSGQGRGSNTLTGEFTVHEVVYGPSGDVFVFDASFEQHSEGFDPALTGHVRFVADGAGGVLANDVDADGDPLSAVLVSGPSHGTLILGADGVPQYSPDADFHGIDTFTYRASDGITLSDPAIVMITVTPVNDAPVANDQSITTAEDTPLSESVTATDVDGDALQFTLEDGPASGTLVLNTDGTFTYTPDANFHGSDTFTFRASDGTVATDPATVTITVTAVNDVPAANDQSVITEEDTPLSGSVTGTDDDGDALQFTTEDGPAHGTLVLNADGTFTYTPDVDFHGTDMFTYRVSDGAVLSDPATVTITIDPVNDAPLVNGQSASTAEDTPVSGSVTAADVDGDVLQFTLESGPAQGTLVLNADGTFTYTPDAEFHGTDGFTFVAHDGTTASQPAAMTITVDPVNDTPVLSGATFTLAENSDVGTTVGTVVGSDIDGDPLTYQIVGGNASGAFTIDAATGVIQVADGAPLDFETTPAFDLTVEAADAGGLLATATVTVTLTDVEETLAVSIDVRPGDSTNTISSNGNGRTEVAIFSTADFDAQSLDVTTLRFGRTGTENSLRWKKGSPVHRYEDINGDGLLDLIVEFERDLMGFYAGDSTAYLTGQTLDGTDIAGADTVNLTGDWPS